MGMSMGTERGVWSRRIGLMEMWDIWEISYFFVLVFNLGCGRRATGIDFRCYFSFRGVDYRKVGLVLLAARTLYSVLWRRNFGGIRIYSPSRRTHCTIGRQRAIAFRWCCM